MRAVVAFLTATASFGSWGAAIADIPATQPSPEVAAFVRDLGSNSQVKQERAEQKLIDMGDDAESQLRGALETNPPEATQKLIDVILNKIADNRSFGPTKITLHYHDQPLMTVLEDFARQAQAEMGIHRKDFMDYVGNRRISIDLDKSSFWIAMDQLSLVGDIRPEWNFEHPTKIGFQPNPNRYPSQILSDRGCMSGPFFVYPSFSYVSRSFTPGAPGQPNPQVVVCVVAEPKINILNLDSTRWGRQCIDELGQPIPLIDTVFSGSTQWTFFYMVMYTDLGDAPHRGNRIARFDGQATATISEKRKVEVFDVNDLRNLSRTVDGERVTLSSLSANESKYQIRVIVQGSNWGMAGAMEDGVQLLDAKDRPLKPGARGSIDIWPGQPQSGTTLNFTAQDAANTPVKLRWEYPSATRKLTIPFELQHLELPHRPLVEAAAVPATVPALSATTTPTTQPDPALAELLRPSSITLHYHNAPLMTVLQDFQKQCSADLGLDRPVFADAKTMRISVDIDNADYWTCGQALCNAAWHKQQEDGFPLRAYLPSYTEPIQGTKVCGPCLVAPVGITRRIQYAGGQGDNEPCNLSISANFYFEPKLHEVDRDVSHWAQKIVDENGMVLGPGGTADNIRQFPGMGNEIAQLTGVIGLELAVGPMDTVQIDDLSAVNEFVETTGPLTFTFHHFQARDNNAYHLAMTVSGNLGKDWQTNPRRLLNRMDFLHADAPSQYAVRNYSVKSKPNGDLDFDLDIEGYGFGDNPTQLRWELPGATEHAEIPIELADLPLPGN